MSGRHSEQLGSKDGLVRSGWSRWVLALSTVGIFVLMQFGCGGGGAGSSDGGSGSGSSSSAAAPPNGVPQDPGAMPLTITSNYCVSPGHLELSKGNRDRYQWHNTSGEDLLIVFKNSAGTEYQPGTELIPSGQFSSVHYVCLTCNEGTYDYRLYHKVGSDWVEAGCTAGTPTVPDIQVGP